MFAAGGGGGGSGDGSRDGISDSISGGSGSSGSGGIPSGGISQEPSQSQLEINICGVDPGGGVKRPKNPHPNEYSANLQIASPLACI